MFDNLKKKLYFMKSKLLLADGAKKGEILYFEDELYQRLSKIYFNGIPLSIHLKYLKPMFSLGQCEDRSMFIAMGLDNALRVSGDHKDLELMYGKDNAVHYWVEHDGWVYDPTFLCKFKRELYYKIYKPTNIQKCRADKYMSVGHWKEILDTKIEDLMPFGKERYHLYTVIPIVQHTAEYEAKLTGNDSFLKELNEYLEEIQYDPKQVLRELNSRINNYTRKKTN